MEDWEHQNPKDHTRVNPSYETQKVKQQKFNIFLEDYFQVTTVDVFKPDLSEIPISQCPDFRQKLQ